VTPDAIDELRSELDAYRNGMLQPTIDPPTAKSPRIEGSTSGGDYALHLQQTHRGMPVWICASCVKVTIASANPRTCLGCGGEGDLGACLHSVAYEDEDHLVAELGRDDQ
jgi:hypothetical protein